MRNWFLIFSITLALGACAPVPTKPVQPSSYWRDADFAVIELPARTEILGVTDAMRHYLHFEIAGRLHRQGILDGLVASLQRDADLHLEYDATRTRTAAEAFVARRGNCLSLTLMTAAMARELGLKVSFRKINAGEVWDRRNGMLINSGHVNIALEPGFLDREPATRRGIVIDFLPAADIAGYRAIEIDEATVLAMFMNNRAVENLAQGDSDAAYAWAKRAIETMPRHFEAYNTLGVIYLRRQLPGPAEAVFREVLAHESENVMALANLSDALSRQGRSTEAAQFQARLQQIEAQPPFYYFDQGIAALKHSDFSGARALLLKELARNANYSQTYFGLALASINLGDVATGKRYLQQAAELAVDSSDRNIYSAKLAHLNELGRRPETGKSSGARPG